MKNNARTNKWRGADFTCVDDSTEEVVEYVGERLGSEHSVEGADEHRPPRIELRGGAAHKVGVCDDPGDDLHLLVAHPATGDLEVPAAAPAVVVGAVVQEILDLERGQRGVQNVWTDRTDSLWISSPVCRFRR